MALAAQTIGDQNVQGTLTATLLRGAHYRSDLTTEALTPFPIPFTQLRVWDAFQTALGAAGSDDLGIGTGTFATGTPYVVSSSARNTTITQYARLILPIPYQMVFGTAAVASLKFSAGMLTTVAGTSATLDCEAYLFNRDTTKTGSDLVTTAAQSINSLTFADKTFDLTATGLSAGSLIDVRLTIAAVDAANVGAVFGAIADMALLCSTKG